MRRNNLLILGVAAGLALTVTLVVADSGPRESTEGLAWTPLSASEEGAAQAAVAEPGACVASPTTLVTRQTAPGAAAEDDSLADPARRREGRRREAQYLAEFQALRTEQGDRVLERTVKDVLASGREPQCRKIAALRALHSADLPGTDAVLAAAVEDQPDVSDGTGASVPRAAIKLLFERAPANADARRELSRLSLAGGSRAPEDLRRAASAALTASTAHAGR